MSVTLLETNSLICLPINWYKISLILWAYALSGPGRQGQLKPVEGPKQNLQHLQHYDNTLFVTSETHVLLMALIKDKCDNHNMIKDPAKQLWYMQNKQHLRQDKNTKRGQDKDIPSMNFG